LDKGANKKIDFDGGKRNQTVAKNVTGISCVLAIRPELADANRRGYDGRIADENSVCDFSPNVTLIPMK
jgi:hypothetical protein